MQERSSEVDSGRSSGSTTSCLAAKSNDSRKVIRRMQSAQRGNVELKVSSRPRSCIALLQKSPKDYDVFPSRKKQVSSLKTENIHKIAHSTMDISSSTKIENKSNLTNCRSMCDIIDSVNVNNNVIKTGAKGKVVQRAASRLYKTEERKGECVGPEFIIRASQPPRQLNLPCVSGNNKVITVVLLNGENVRVLCDPTSTTAGQIFQLIVNSEKYEHSFMLGMAVLLCGDFIFLPEDYKMKKVAPDGWCPKTQIKIKQLKKCKTNDSNVSFTVFLRIKFYLPPNISKNLLGGDWRKRVYLQLRRSTLEGQLSGTLQQFVQLAGYALHIEFGDFFYRDHGSGDYFLLEHYLPEGSYTENNPDIKLQMKRAHESRRGMDKEMAMLNFIILAQSCKDYGAHFYSATWVTRDGFSHEVWFSIAPRGIILYSRSSILTHRVVLQCLPWLQIHTFYYNKKTLYIVPKSHSNHGRTGSKYKLKMEENKPYFIYWLASLHHRFYLKLYAENDFISYLSGELSYPVSPKYSNENNHNIESTDNPSLSSTDFSDYPESYHIALRNQSRLKKPIKRKFTFSFNNKKTDINKENEIPLTKLIQCSPNNLNDSNQSKYNYSSNECLSSSESCSLPRRQGVKMGTKVIHGTPKKSLPDKPKLSHSSTFTCTNTLKHSDNEICSTQSDSDDLQTLDRKQKKCNINKMELLPKRLYNHHDTSQSTLNSQAVYVVESPRVYKDDGSYNPTTDETFTNASIFAKLDSLGCIQAERHFVTAVVVRDKRGAVGLQVAEGSDGNVYIKSITPEGPADKCKKLVPGDQIISVNGQTLLNVQYIKALTMLQTASSPIEMIVLQNLNQDNNTTQQINRNRNDLRKKNISQNSSIFDLRSNLTTESFASGLDDVTPLDDKILNEEALKTINALINLTKQNVIMRLQDESNLNTPNKILLQKCLSDNKVYDESGVENNNVLHESTPIIKCSNRKISNTWRLKQANKAKRRPLSLHIPADELSNNYLDDVSFKMRSYDNVSVLEKSLVSDCNEKINEQKFDNLPYGNYVAVPRNFGLSRKWLGPVRYPVTPCKNIPSDNAIFVRKHFLYENSDDEQIFL